MGIQQLEVKLRINRKGFKRQSATIKTDGQNDREDLKGNGKVLLTHSTLRVLKEPVQDKTSHQRWRQIHLYRDRATKRQLAAMDTSAE